MNWELVIRCKDLLDGWLAGHGSLPNAILIGAEGEETHMIGSVDGVPVIESGQTNILRPGEMVCLGSLTEVEAMLARGPTATIRPDPGRLASAATDQPPKAVKFGRTRKSRK